MFKAEKSLSDFIHGMIEKGHTTTALYVLSARDKLFSYVKLWLKTGEFFY